MPNVKKSMVCAGVAAVLALSLPVHGGAMPYAKDSLEHENSGVLENVKLKEADSTGVLQPHVPVMRMYSGPYLFAPASLPAGGYKSGETEFPFSRPLTGAEILARDRELLLMRMIYGNPVPEFVMELQRKNPFGANILLFLLGLLSVGGPSNMDMLVPPVEVGGTPYFDDMIFLDPNFDPRVYSPSRPVPQYDPLDPSRPYREELRNSGQGKSASGPPPVMKSRYAL